MTDAILQAYKDVEAAVELLHLRMHDRLQEQIAQFLLQLVVGTRIDRIEHLISFFE